MPNGCNRHTKSTQKSTEKQQKHHNHPPTMILLKFQSIIQIITLISSVFFIISFANAIKIEDFSKLSKNHASFSKILFSNNSTIITTFGSENEIIFPRFNSNNFSKCGTGFWFLVISLLAFCAGLCWCPCLCCQSLCCFPCGCGCSSVC